MHKWFSFIYIDLKGQSINFTYQAQLTCHGKYCSACENGSIISFVGLRELCRVWENNPGDVTVMSSGLSWRGFGDRTFLTTGLHYNEGMKDIYQAERVSWKMCCIMGNVRSSGLELELEHRSKCALMQRSFICLVFGEATTLHSGRFSNMDSSLVNSQINHTVDTIKKQIILGFLHLIHRFNA